MANRLQMFLNEYLNVAVSLEADATFSLDVECRQYELFKRSGFLWTFMNFF